ncbi:MAG: hypothetical protein HYS27_14995 [Deltaproteobacteria bacterium]|nr:hypothetical protein [Deltaproteobacteria bacterium]
MASALALVLALSAAGVAAPHLEWRTLHGQHCDVHFPAALEPVARRVVTVADEAVAVTSAAFESGPLDRVQLVLHDVTDTANGFTNVVPYDLIELRAVPPEGDHELGVTDEYLRMLVLHEMAHIVHLDTIHGLPALVNLVVGKVWPPNIVQPRFVVEGLATWIESEHTEQGRLRSTQFLSHLRIAALQGDLWQLDDLANYSRREPGGGAAYVYGAAFVDWLARRHGAKVWAAVAHDYGGMPVPYAMQRAVEAATGVELGLDYQAFLDDVRADAAAFAAKKRARGGATSARRLTRVGGTARAPRFAADGAVLVGVAPTFGSAGLFELRGLPARAPPLAPVVRVAQAADLALVGDTTVLAQAEVSRGSYTFSDLWRVERSGDGAVLVRVTHEARVRAPSPVPGTRRVICEQKSAADSALVEVDVDTGALVDVVRFVDGTLAFSPDVDWGGRRVVYSRWTPGGGRDLVVRELRSGLEQELTHDGAQDLDPHWSIDGARVLFASDREDTFNLYAIDVATREVRRVVDTLGLARLPVPTPDGRAVLFLDTGLDGQDLYAAPFDWASAPVVGGAPPAPARRALSRAAMGEVEPYNPLPTLLPRTWTPLLASDALGGTALGVAVAGEDAAGRLAAAAQATWGFAMERPRMSGTVRLADLYLPISLGAEWRTDRSEARRTTDGLPEVQQETVVAGYANLTVPLLRRRRHSHSLVLGYQREAHLVENPMTSPPDARAPTYPPSGNVAAVTLDWGYQGAHASRDSVSADEGVSSWLRVRHANPLLGSELELWDVLIDVRAFQPVPGLPGHAVGALISGGVGIGDPFRRASFSLGGIVDRDLTRDLLEGRRAGPGMLRGYPRAVVHGDAQALATLEYRLPLLELERGIETLPLFVDRVHGAAFTDLGLAFSGAPVPTSFLAGVGAELRVEVGLGYYGFFLVRLGWARGVNQGGVDQPYVVMGFPY